MFSVWGVKRSVAKELTAAIERNDQNAVQDVLNACSSLEVNYQGKRKDKQTALMRACKKGDAFIVQTLLSCPDVDVNLVDHVGNTALIIACEEGNADAVRELLSRHEINVNAINETGNSALTWACILGHTSIARQLINHPAINVNGKSPEADTPLIYAARHGRIDIVRLLVDHPNIDIFATDMHGTNALDAAGDTDIQMLLQKNGVTSTPMRRPISVSMSPLRSAMSFPGDATAPFTTHEMELPLASPQPANIIAPFASQAEVQVVAIADSNVSSVATPTELQSRLESMRMEKSRLEDTILSLTNQNSAHLCTIHALQGTIQALTMQVASLQVQNKQMQQQQNLEKHA